MKKLFLNFVLPVFLLISAVVLIGSGCQPPEEPEEENDNDFQETASANIKSVNTLTLYS